jgi:hypothetical protein
MISFQQIRKFVLSMILTMMLVITIGFDFGHVDSWARASHPQVISQNQPSTQTINQTDTITKNMISKDQLTPKS